MSFLSKEKLGMGRSFGKFDPQATERERLVGWKVEEFSGHEVRLAGWQAVGMSQCAILAQRSAGPNP
jgi:hypothetical protein